MTYNDRQIWAQVGLHIWDSTGIICIGVSFRPSYTNHGVFLARQRTKLVFSSYTFLLQIILVMLVLLGVRAWNLFDSWLSPVRNKYKDSQFEIYLRVAQFSTMEETATASTISGAYAPIPRENVQAHPAATDPVPNETPRRHLRPQAIFSDLHILVPAYRRP